MRAQLNKYHRLPSMQRESPTLMLLVFVAAIGAILYANFLLNPINQGDLLPYVLVIFAEIFIIFHAIIALWTILGGGYNPRDFEFHAAQDEIFSDKGKKFRYDNIVSDDHIQPQKQKLFLHGRQINIDVFVTVYGEPLKTVKETVVAARDITGRHTTYILDDGGSDDVRQLARELGVEYIRRDNNTGAKAGNINHALQLTQGEFFVVLDADFVPEHNFLYEMVQFFEDKNIAFVQSPQIYRNSDNVISKGAGYMQMVFYRLIMTGKNRFNAAFCVGTNVIFRRSAIRKIGGMYQKSKSEDIWTSILLHEKGYKSVYIPDILASGSTPDTIKAYSKQQLRWATGGFQILFYHNPLTKKLSVDQKLQYLSTVTYYLHGIAIMMLFLLPALHIFFNLTPVDISIAFTAWILFYLAFYGLQISLAFYTMGGFRFEALLLAMVSFPIYVRAFFNGLLKREESWQATGNPHGVDSPYNYIIPQILLLIFLVFTTLVGVWKSYYYGTPSLALFWSLLNTAVFGTFVYIAHKEHRQLKKERKEELRLSGRSRMSRRREGTLA